MSTPAYELGPSPGGAACSLWGPVSPLSPALEVGKIKLLLCLIRVCFYFTG